MNIILFADASPNNEALLQKMRDEGHVAHLADSSSKLFEFIATDEFLPNLFICDDSEKYNGLEVYEKLKTITESKGSVIEALFFCDTSDRRKLFTFTAHGIDLMISPVDTHSLIAKLHLIESKRSGNDTCIVQREYTFHKEEMDKLEFISHQIASIHNLLCNIRTTKASAKMADMIEPTIQNLNDLLAKLSLNSNKEIANTDLRVLDYIRMFFQVYNTSSQLMIDNSNVLLRIDKKYFIAALNNLFLELMRILKNENTLHISYNRDSNSLKFICKNISAEQIEEITSALHNEFLMKTLDLNSAHLKISVAQNDMSFYMLFHQSSVAILDGNMAA